MLVYVHLNGLDKPKRMFSVLYKLMQLDNCWMDCLKLSITDGFPKKLLSLKSMHIRNYSIQLTTLWQQ